MIFDELDAKLLRYIQRDLSTSLEKLGEEIGLSRNAVWRRLKSLEEAGIIKDKVALLDQVSLDCGCKSLYRSGPSNTMKHGAISFQAPFEAYPIL